MALLRFFKMCYCCLSVGFWCRKTFVNSSEGIRLKEQDHAAVAPLLSEEELAALIEYGREGSWENIIKRLDEEESYVTAGRICRYSDPAQGWSLLHHAASAGHGQAIRKLIKFGANPHLKTKQGEQEKGEIRGEGEGEEGEEGVGGMTAEEIARSKGHVQVAELLSAAARISSGVWVVHDDCSLMPSSHGWWDPSQCQLTQPPYDFEVGYGGRRVRLTKGRKIVVDQFGRLLVGWHGSHSPPLGMDFNPLIEMKGVRKTHWKNI
eukprot:TRINITY_DN5594_c0_g2_i1.p1 TRINITY_DN5594_c0_g2~~TRINITY_DN5594_c0_g2_i1.p1  ORF type:complete len:264 (+),score=51.53 TRINITY_DN5594_c0_g2_i1:188-979(+)